MEYAGEVTMGADAQTLWETVSDPRHLTMCVPGAKEVERISETQYEGVIERTVAGVTIELASEVELTELDPPERVVVNAIGSDARTGSRMEAHAVMTMSENDDGSAILVYEIEMSFSGRLATLGSRIIRRQISSDIDTFFDNVRDVVENQP